jgi:alkylhydroperoxidase family enzyme
MFEFLAGPAARALRSRHVRIEPVPVPADTNPLEFSALARILARRPEVLEANRRLNFALRFGGLLSVELKEAVRRSTAEMVGCVYCASLSEPRPQAADSREDLAVAFAQMVADDPKAITDAQFDVLREEFSDDEIVELVAWICLVVIAGQTFGAVMKVDAATPEEASAYQAAIRTGAAARQ